MAHQIVRLQDGDHILNQDVDLEITMTHPIHIYLVALPASTKVPIVIRKLSFNDHPVFIAAGQFAKRSQTRLRSSAGEEKDLIVIGQHGTAVLRLNYDLGEDVWTAM